MEDIEFTPEQHKTWAELYGRQVPRVRQHASRHYLDGFDQLELPADHIPSLDELNARITPASGWTVVRTDVRYTSSDDWYRFFERHEFLVTNYMRSWEELDWTPEPDMFHDIFGHLPFWMSREYAEIQEMFAPVYFAAASDEERAGMSGYIDSAQDGSHRLGDVAGFSTAAAAATRKRGSAARDDAARRHGDDEDDEDES